MGRTGEQGGRTELFLGSWDGRKQIHRAHLPSKPREANFSAPAVVSFEGQAQGDGEMDAWNPNLPIPCKGDQCPAESAALG